MFLALYLFVSFILFLLADMSIGRSVFICFLISARLYLCPSACLSLSVCLTAFLSFRLTACVSFSLPSCLPTRFCLPACLLVSYPVYLPVCLPTCFSFILSAFLSFTRFLSRPFLARNYNLSSDKRFVRLSVGMSVRPSISTNRVRA